MTRAVPRSRSSAPASAGWPSPTAWPRTASTTWCILERDDGVGGTWRANRYPGAACDVPSHLYSLSFAPNPRLVARLRHPARDPPLRRGLLRPLRRPPQGAHRPPRSWPATWLDGDACWRLRDRRRRRARGRRSWSRPSACSTPRRSPTSPASTSSAGTVVPLGPLGPRPRPRPAGGSRSSAPAPAPSRSCPPSPTGPPTSTSTSAPPRGSCRARTSRTRAEQQRQFAARPDDRGPPPPAAARPVRGDHRVRRRRPGRPRASRRRPRLPRAQGRRPRACGPSSPPATRSAAQRTLVSSDYYPAVAARRRRAGHRRASSASRPTGVRTVDGVERPADTIVLCTGFHAADYLRGIEVVGRGGVRHPRPLGRRAPGLPRHGRPRLPELLHALRAQHQPGRQLDPPRSSRPRPSSWPAHARRHAGGRRVRRSR